MLLPAEFESSIPRQPPCVTAVATAPPALIQEWGEWGSDDLARGRCVRAAAATQILNVRLVRTLLCRIGSF
jgi:hypothetical protein